MPVHSSRMRTFPCLLHVLCCPHKCSANAVRCSVTKMAEIVADMDMDCPGYCAFFARVIGMCVAKKMLGPKLLTSAWGAEDLIDFYDSREDRDGNGGDGAPGLFAIACHAVRDATSMEELAALLKAGGPDWDVFSLARKGRSPEEAAEARKKLVATLSAKELAHLFPALSGGKIESHLSDALGKDSVDVDATVAWLKVRIEPLHNLLPVCAATDSLAVAARTTRTSARHSARRPHSFAR